MAELGINSKSISATIKKQAKDFPIATYSLIILNAFLYLGSLPGDQIDLANRYGLIPDRLEFLRLFTAIFLHFDSAHLLINIFFLWLVGRKVERAMGPVIFLFLYIVSGFMASLLHVLVTLAFLPPNLMDTPVVGASGAVAGVMGMYAVRFSHEKLTIGRFSFHLLYLLLFWFLIQIAFGAAGIFSPHIGTMDITSIAYWSHIGGFIFGMTAAWVMILHKSDGPSADLRTDDLRHKILLDVVQRLRILCEADPTEPFVHAELGRLRAILGDQAGSVASYYSAVELYRKEGHHDDALACLEEALRYWPVTSLDYNTVFRLACLYESLGEAKSAFEKFAWLANEAHGSPEAEMSLIKLAQIELNRFNSPEETLSTIELFKRDYPNSQWMDLADQILARVKSE